MGDFGEQTLADFLLMLREFQFLEPFAQVHNRHLNQFGDALSANLHIVGFLLESGAMAIRTDGLASESAQHHTVLYLVLVLLHHSEEFVDAHPVVRVALLVRRQSMPEPVFLLLGEFVVRLEDREVVWLRTSDEFLEPHAHLLSTPAYHASIVEAHGSIRDDELLVDAYHASESLAGRAGTQWGIEGKHVVGWFLEGDAVGFEPGREIIADIAWQEEETAGTVALIESSLGRIDEAADVVLLIAYRSTVDDEEDILRLGIALEIVDADEFTFHQNACVSLLKIHLQLLFQASAFYDM